MSHHDAPEVQVQIEAKLARMFKEIVKNEDVDIPLEVGDTVTFQSITDDTSLYLFTIDELGFGVDFTEEQIDGFLHDQESTLEYVDGCVYGVICDIEDYLTEIANVSEDDDDDDDDD